MDFVIDNLFSVLPVAFVVIWLIRRGSRRSGKQSQSRTRQQKAADGGDGKAASFRNTAAPEVKSWPGRGVLDNALGKINEFVDELQGEKPAAPRGEDELYDRMDSHRIDARPPEVKPAPPKEGRHSLFSEADVAARSHQAAVPEESGLSSLDRISRLPPLAQGILWSVVLDEPPALKEPNHW